MVLGVDRDSGEVQGDYDERNPAVSEMIASLVAACTGADAGKTGTATTHVGFCGQAPSDHPGYAEWLQRIGIHDISVTPDVAIRVIHRLTRDHKERLRQVRKGEETRKGGER